MCSMQSSAGILHADLDAFFAAVAQRDRPELRGRPVAVGPGIVTSASYEARAFGVRGAMPERQARALCPDLVVVPGDFDAYTEASRAVFAIFEETTPLVEGISIDEAFLDVRGLARSVGSPTDIATTLRDRVRDEVGLPLSVGIARTKFLAKVASVSAKPDGLVVVEPDDEVAFLHPLPVRRMWGVGPATEAVLVGHGIQTIADLVTVGEGALVALLGRHTGRHLFALAVGRDHRPVEPRRRRRSFGAQRALGRRALTLEQLGARLADLVDGLARRARSAERCATTVTLRLRFGDFTRATRSRTLSHPADRTDVLVDAARSLLVAAGPLIAERGCTLIGASLSGLVPHRPQQLVLPFDRSDRTALDEALDQVRDRFGRTAVGRAATLAHGHHRPMPTLPEPGATAD
ncbi:MAG: DNA polymerase IV [Actinobacteria bacterium]|nr:DNA polymerase IV [Actinomycetota bacterium]